tara:strand:+ start:1283 stop:1966 length:684 start_codon:yes stop_codon:yes gene_type:complete
MLPESLRRVWDTLDDEERARLNLIIMNYFDPYQPRAESPMDESDQLEAIVDDFMVERMGGKGAFIHNYKIDPAELGQVEHDKKYLSPAGEHQYIRYNDILYHPDDRKDLEMKYASADTAFDTAWALLKEGEPVVEFDGNDKCPDCGGKRTQKKTHLGYGFPIVHGWDCRNCGTFTPHDWDYAMKETEISNAGAQDPYGRKLCSTCLGTGDYPEGEECWRCKGRGLDE